MTTAVAATAISSGSAPAIASANPRDPYEPLNAVLDALAGAPADLAARMRALREYIALGLGGPAAELLVEIPAGPDVEALRSAARRSSGKQVWGKRAGLFSSNVRVLEGRGIDPTPLRTAWRDARDAIELYADVAGVEHIRVRGPGGWEWFPARLDDPARAAAALALPDDFRESMPGPFIFEGLGTGQLLRRVWRETRRTFLSFCATIHVIERDPAWVALALHLHDWSELFADPAVMLYFGDGGLARFEEAISGDWSLGVPRRLLKARAGAAGGDVVAAIGRVEARRAGYFEDLRSAVETRYAGRDAAHWAARFASALRGEGPPLRILASVSRHTTFLKFSMRDALRAFEQIGCRTRLLTEQADHDRIGAALYLQAIREFEPDLFFVIDHLRTSFGAALPASLPVLTWDQDDLPHIFRDENIRRMTPLDVVTGILHLLPIARGAGRAEQFLGSQIATSPEQFDAAGLADADLAAYRCDISFVSHAAQTPGQLHDEERARCNDSGLRKIMDAIFETVMARATAGPADGGVLDALLSEAERRCGLKITDPATRDRLRGWYVWRLCDRVFRHEALGWAAEWARQTGHSLRIYGNGWDAHPTLAGHAAGPAANGRELVAIYRGSAINIQLMPGGFIHQRALDGLCAGGFFLTRRTAADQRNPRLGPLWREIGAAKLHSGAALLAAGDPELIARFIEVGRSIGRAAAEAEVIYQFLRFNPSWDYPAEVFADFDQIVFDSRDSFFAAAGRFSADAALRERVAAEMRARVIERYSYRSVMERFLRFHADYLASSAVMTERGAQAG